MSDEIKLAKTIFLNAIDKPAPQRLAYLDKACGPNSALRQRVEALLRAHDAGTSFLEQPLAQAALEVELSDPTIGVERTAAIEPGTKVRYVGDYELLDEIARGGMGVVYKARQVSLDRIVALKMILAGRLASEADVQRFVAEAKAAGNLKHPHIVAIHEVGQYQDHHYYSMDYVEGHSLAEAVRDHPLLPEQAARYVETLARAIDFAHRQGTLHRDIKPSNVLIDAHDEPHITDFGLAKSLGVDTRLTATGAIMGTPSYMPPEQARGDTALGPACDVYALGAVLYELVTGRPPFRAATVLETLRQVTDADAAPPRTLNPAINRDLETIILKCLSKEPSQRYASAKELANDLRACRNGDAIQARRPSLAERGFRWLRQKQSTLTLALKAVALFVLVGVLGWLAWTTWFASSRIGLLLDTEGPSLVAEVLRADRDEPVTRFRVPHEDPISLQAGSYRVRLSAHGLLDETFRLHLPAGDSTPFRGQFPIGLGANQLWAPRSIPWDDLTTLVNLEGRADLIIGHQNRLSRVHGATGETIWEQAFVPPVALRKDKEKDKAGPVQRLPLQSMEGRPGRLALPAPDLDGDGVRDLVLTGHWYLGDVANPDLLWALSGRDGKELWFAETSGSIIGTPTTIDAEKTPDLITTVVVPVDTKGTRKPGSRWIESFSGKDSASRWAHEIDGRWEGPVSSATQVWPVRIDDRTKLVCLDGNRLVGLDARTGKATFAHDLGFRPAQVPQFADLDGDGRDDTLCMRLDKDGQVSLVTHSLANGKRLWEYRLTMKVGLTPVLADLDGTGRMDVIVINHETQIPPSNGPQISRAVDASVPVPRIEPVIEMIQEPAAPHNDWAAEAVEVVDGKTGQVRWAQRFAGRILRGGGHNSQRAVMVGPDANGDRLAELFVATWPAAGQRRTGFEVHALAGKKGQILWKQRVEQDEFDDPIQRDQGEPVDPGLHGVWTASPSGQALIVRARLVQDRRRDQRGDVVLLLNSTTGRVEQRLADATNPQLADLNGDGLPDLTYRVWKHSTWTAGGPRHLVAIRGGPPVEWRHLGACIAGADFDGDGVADWLSLINNRTAAVSGRDGRLLWHARDKGAGTAASDLDGDGVPDLLLSAANHGRPSSLLALSGKDGRTRLWNADHLHRERHQPRRFDFFDLDGDGRPEVIYFYLASERAHTTDPEKSWIAILNGSDGSLRWQQSFTGTRWQNDRKFGRPDQPDERIGDDHDWADLDGDGVLDLVLPVRTGAGLSLQAFSGKDGSTLWQHALVVRPDMIEGGLPLLRLALATQGGNIDVACFIESQQQLLLIDGKTGRPRWQTPTKGGSLSRPPVFVDFAGNGRPVVCFYECTETSCQVVQFDDKGQRAQSFAIDMQRPHAILSPLLALDLAGDKKQHLVITNGNRLQALNRDGKVVWSWQAPDGIDAKLLPEMRAATKDHPAGLTVQCRHTVYGIDAKTGATAWRGDLSSIPGRVVLNAAKGWPSALVQSYAVGPTFNATYAVRSLPTAADGTYRLERSAAAQENQVDTEVPSRPLPWGTMDGLNSHVMSMLPFLLLVIACVTMGAWVNLTRLLGAAALVGGVMALVALANDVGHLQPGQAYDMTGWYLPVLTGAMIVGWTLVPALVVVGLLRLFGLRSGWVPGAIATITCVLLAMVFLMVMPLRMEGPGEQVPAHNGLLAGAVGMFFGGVMILGPGLAALRRRWNADPNAEASLRPDGELLENVHQ